MAGQVTGASAAQLAKKIREEQQGAGKQPEPVPVPSDSSSSDEDPIDEDVHDPIEAHGTPESARKGAEELSSDEEEQSMVEELLHHARIHAGKFGSNPPDTRPTQT